MCKKDRRNKTPHRLDLLPFWQNLYRSIGSLVPDSFLVIDALNGGGDCRKVGFNLEDSLAEIFYLLHNFLSERRLIRHFNDHGLSLFDLSLGGRILPEHVYGFHNFLLLVGRRNIV